MNFSLYILTTTEHSFPWCELFADVLWT